MTNINFEPYFENTSSKYYDARCIIEILESILGNKLDNIRNSINSVQITVTEEQIKEFLEKNLKRKNQN